MKRLLVRSLFVMLLVTLAEYSFVQFSPFNAQSAKAETNGAALRPLPGWSSWSLLRTNPTEATFEQQALTEARLLRPHGYIYANLDDYWYLNPATTVDQYGRWAVDTSAFPHGIAALANYTHSLGLRFGLYVTPGIPVAAVNQNMPIEGTPYHAQDIANTSEYEPNYNFKHTPIGQTMYAIDYSKPGAQAFINSWARLFASWGVDFLKLDGVGGSSGDDLPDIKAWSLGLRLSGRVIYYELSNSLNVSDTPVLRQYANGWRISGDIENYSNGINESTPLTGWEFSPFGSTGGVVTRFSLVPQWAKYAGPGGWNDLDSLDVGNGTMDGLTNDERQSYMTLWAISAVPLYSGDDLTELDSYGLSLLTNDEVLAVDQAGVPATPLSTATSQQVWSAREYDGSYVVALFNLASSSATVTVNWSDLGITKPILVRDLWSHTILGAYNIGSVRSSFSATLDAHGSRLLRITPTL